jgi:hypothetical protein
MCIVAVTACLPMNDDVNRRHCCEDRNQMFQITLFSDSQLKPLLDDIMQTPRAAIRQLLQIFICGKYGCLRRIHINVGLPIPKEGYVHLSFHGRQC